MLAHEIVEGEAERQRVSVIFSLFAESIHEPRNPTHGEVVTLGIEGAHVRQVGTALYAAKVNARAFTGAVAAQDTHWCTVCSISMV